MDGRGHLRGQEREQPDVIGAEVTDGVGTDQEAADRPAVDEERRREDAGDAELAGPLDRVRRALVVGDRDRLSPLEGEAGDAHGVARIADLSPESRVILGQDPKPLLARIPPAEAAGLGVEKVAGVLGGEAGERTGIKNAADGDGQVVEGGEGPRPHLALLGDAGRLHRGPHLGRQQAQELGVPRGDLPALVPAHGEAADDDVLDQDGHRQDALHPQRHRGWQRVLPGCIILDRHRRAFPVGEAVRPGRLRVPRSVTELGVVIGQRHEGSRRMLEADQHPAMPTEQVAGLLDRQLGQGDRVEDSTGGHGQLVQGTEHVSLQLALCGLARCFESGRQLSGEEGQHLDIGIRELASGVGPDSEHADRAVPDDQGNRGGRDHSPGNGALHRLLELLVVVDDDRFAALKGQAHRALPGQAGGLGARGRSFIEGLQQARLLVPGEDHGTVHAEKVAGVADRQSGQLGGIEDATGGDRDLVQGTECAGLLVALARLARTLQRGADLGGEQGEDPDLVRLEVTRRVSAHDEAAECHVADHEGDREQASDARLDGPFGRILPVLVIVDQNRAAAHQRETGGALTGHEPPHGNDVGRMVFVDHQHRAIGLQPVQRRAPGVGEVAGLVRHQPAQLAGIEHSAGRHGDSMQSLQAADLDVALGGELRGLQRRGHLGREEPEQLDRLGVHAALATESRDERSHGPIIRHQRNGEDRADVLSDRWRDGSEPGSVQDDRSSLAEAELGHAESVRRLRSGEIGSDRQAIEVLAGLVPPVEADGVRTDELASTIDGDACDLGGVDAAQGLEGDLVEDLEGAGLGADLEEQPFGAGGETALGLHAARALPLFAQLALHGQRQVGEVALQQVVVGPGPHRARGVLDCRARPDDQDRQVAERCRDGADEALGIVEVEVDDRHLDEIPAQRDVELGRTDLVDRGEVAAGPQRLLDRPRVSLRITDKQDPDGRAHSRWTHLCTSGVSAQLPAEPLRGGVLSRSSHRRSGSVPGGLRGRAIVAGCWKSSSRIPVWRPLGWRSRPESATGTAATSGSFPIPGSTRTS